MSRPTNNEEEADFWFNMMQLYKRCVDVGLEPPEFMRTMSRNGFAIAIMKSARAEDIEEREDGISFKIPEKYKNKDKDEIFRKSVLSEL